MRRHLITAGIIMTVFSSVLTGCGSRGGTKAEQTAAGEVKEQPITLKVWGAEEDLELLEEITEKFVTVHKDELQINITVEATSEGECKYKLLSNVNEGADVFTFADDQLRQMAASGVLEEIQYSTEVSNENVEGAVEAATINEKVYAYPITADNGYVMFYNKKYFKDSDVETLDGMLSVAEKAGKKITMDWASGWYLYSFFGNTGMWLGLNDDGVTNYCDYNRKDGAIKGIDVAKAMYDISRSKAFLDTTDDGLLKGAKEGSVIAGVSGIWSASALQEAWGDDFAAVKLPTYTCAGQQVQMASFAGYKMVGVNAYSKEREWAEKLAQFISNEENQTLRFVKRGQGPSNINAAESDEVKQSVAIQAVLAQSEFASLQRIGANYWLPMQAFGESFGNNTANEKNLQQLLDKMVKGITAAITD